MALHESLANLLSTGGTHQSLFEFHPDAIFVIGADSLFYDCNPKTEELSGYSRKDLLGNPYQPMVVPEDLERTERHFRDTMNGRAQTFELSFFHASGERRAITLTCVPVVSNGETIGLYGIARDITERLQTQHLLAHSRSELVKLQDAFHLIAENMSDLLALTDSRGYIEFVSRSFELAIGVTLEEIAGRHIFQWIHPEDRILIETRYNRGGKRLNETLMELRMRNAEGGYVLLESRAVPILAPSGEVLNYLIVSRDIRERKRTEELLLQTEKLSIAGQLAAGIAHEIRNPLTAIKGFIQMMRRSGTFEGRYLSIVWSELERIETILTELLLLAKPQAVEMVRKDLSDILNDVITLSDTQAILKNVRISARFEAGLPPIECVESQIKQIFINFIKNAIDAMPGGGEICIETERHGDHHVIVRFIDQGVGISDELIPKLGEPFYTTKEKGTGLGLMVSRKIVEQHHGRLSFASRVGEGTTVTVLLPIEQPRDQR